jgi:hypothetical protein
LQLGKALAPAPKDISTDYKTRISFVSTVDYAYFTSLRIHTAVDSSSSGVHKPETSVCSCYGSVEGLCPCPGLAVCERAMLAAQEEGGWTALFTLGNQKTRDADSVHPQVQRFSL